MPGAHWHSRPDRQMPTWGAFDPSAIADDETRSALEIIRKELWQLKQGCDIPLYGLRAHCWNPDITRPVYGDYLAGFNEHVLLAPEGSQFQAHLPDAARRPGGIVEIEDFLRVSGTVNATIRTIKGQKINGSDTYTISTNGAVVQFRSNGFDWTVIGQGAGGSSTAAGSGSGDVTAAASMTDHTLVRGDGGAKGVQGSGVTLDDFNNIGNVAALSTTSIELGHASDTTLTRLSAGVVGVEGNALLRADQNLGDVDSVSASLTNLSILRAIVDGDDGNTSTTMAATDHMSLTVSASTRYEFEAWLDVSFADGMKFDFDGGTATMTSIKYDVVFNKTTGTAGGDVISKGVSALATDVQLGAAEISLAGTVHIKGHLNVNGAGTFIMRHSSEGGAVAASVLDGSWMRLTLAS